MSDLSPIEKTEKLMSFYAPERMLAHASGETFVIDEAMQARAESFGYDRTRADAASATDEPATTSRTRPGRPNRQE